MNIDKIKSLGPGGIAKIIFWCWSLITLIISLPELFNGDALKSMYPAVDYATAHGQPSPLSREETAKLFVIISEVYFVASMLLGALLVHKSARKRRWALILLIPLGLWQAYEAIYYPFAMISMYHASYIPFSTWLFAVLGAVAWLLIIGLLSYGFYSQRESKSD